MALRWYLFQLVIGLCKPPLKQQLLICFHIFDLDIALGNPVLSNSCLNIVSQLVRLLQIERKLITYVFFSFKLGFFWIKKNTVNHWAWKTRTYVCPIYKGPRFLSANVALVIFPWKWSWDSRTPKVMVILTPICQRKVCQ